uniref:hypothetical protein n=1 Tax=Bartonella sp. AC134YNZD TaxID=3243446 RepID=UPI0035CFB088
CKSKKMETSGNKSYYSGKYRYRNEVDIVGDKVFKEDVVSVTKVDDWIIDYSLNSAASNYLSIGLCQVIIFL